MINLIAANDRIIVTLIEKKASGGIILTGHDSNPWQYGRIEAIGPNVKITEVGKVVLFYKCDATPLEVDNILYYTIRECHIIGIYKN
ncbi:MAG: co-chaperone GroES [Candidatus Omnitrophica bacterium]|jgi:co-chaperonin GroES (HSP10)|nr:co-chaperone GroES [Candidatus Omnitrophota bacterium]